MSVFASLGDLATGQSNSRVIMGALCHDLQEGLETNGQPHGHQQILKGLRGLPELAASMYSASLLLGGIHAAHASRHNCELRV